VFTGNSSGSGVAWMAHVGGFAFGAAVLWLLVRLQGRRPSGGQRIYRMQW
jgi:membrane associated rhomboid family serine protease